MKVWYRKLKGTNVIFVAKHITFLSLGKKRRLLRLEATMPHPQQLKKKRKKGNTKVERSRELQNSSIQTFFFALTFLASSPSSFQMLLTFQFSFVPFVPFLMQTLVLPTNLGTKMVKIVNFFFWQNDEESDTRSFIEYVLWFPILVQSPSMHYSFPCRARLGLFFRTAPKLRSSRWAFFLFGHHENKLSLNRIRI